MEENLQDVNELIYPFGLRPNVPDFSIINLIQEEAKESFSKRDGSRFYIGSGEALYKNWTGIQVKSNWKDVPSSFTDHYAAYVKGGLKAQDFKIKVEYLKDGQWVNLTGDSGKNENDLFPFKEEEPNESQEKPSLSQKGSEDQANEEEKPEADNNSNRDVVIWKFTPDRFLGAFPEEMVPPLDFDCELVDSTIDIIPKSVDTDLIEYDANSRFGFIRLTLTNQDFLHKDYSFALARQLMALGRYPDDDFLPGAIISKTRW